MSKKVYTYSKITELKNAPYFREIATIPQITMSMEMYAQMAFDMRILRQNILGFSVFVKRLFPYWGTSTQRFLYMTSLNHFLRNKIEAAKDKAERDWLYGCKKNLYAAINNIIKLEEAKVRPEDISDDDRDMKLFKEMWNLVLNIKEDASRESIILDFRADLEKYSNSEVFIEEVNKIFRFHGQNKIVLHGFQYFTPMQQFVYDAFCNAGFDIYALLPCDEKYPYANEIWDHLYNTSNGFPDKKDWVKSVTDSSKNPLGEIFETGEKTTANNVRLIKYSNTIEFIMDIPRIKEEGYYIYCSDDCAANNMLKDYFPERYEERNLLAYPVGQFIYTLHQMWDENLQCIVLNADGLRKCFASGWLSYNHESSMNYTEDLERMLPYFEGCYTVDDWNDRLQVYMESFENAIDVFAVEPSGDAVKDRTKELLGNPFKHFGAFSVKEDRIESVLTIIKKMMDMARKLFGKNVPISIYEHLNKLDSMLYMNDGMPPELYQEEKKRVKQIFDVLESDRIKDFLCYPGDIATTMLSFMNGHLDEENDKKGELKTLVFNLFQVDAAPIGAKGKVHVCLADINKLPGANGRYTWPLDEKTLDEILENKKNTYIDNWIQSMKISALGNRYYIFSALNNEDVEISWIEKQGEKVLAPSPYVTLLDKLSNVHITVTEAENLSLEHVSDVSAKSKLELNYDIKTNRDLHQIDAELEYASCPMRFVYSYVLGDNPTYVGSYQQGRAIVRFIQMLDGAMKNPIEQIADEVFALFPNIRKAEKRQLLDYAKGRRMDEPEIQYTVYDGLKYNNRRLDMLFPDEDTYKWAMQNYSSLMSPDGRKGVFFDRLGKGDCHNCELCPHENYCMKSLFGIDYKMEKN